MTFEQLQVLRSKQKELVNSGKLKDYRKRLDLINRLEKNVRDHEVDIFEALRQDLGRSDTASFMIELGPFYHELKYIKSKLRGIFKLRKVYSPAFMIPAKSYVQREPYGQVLIIAPWNYPVSLALSPLLSAIACGNTVVLKPSEISSHVSDVLEMIIRKTFSPEIVDVVKGGAEQSTMLLDQRWDYIFFTGSTAVGKIVAKKAAEYLTPVTLELGGKSPTIVTKNADIKVAARRIVFGKFTNGGQTCVAPDYVYVHSSVRDEFIKAFIFELKRQYGEDVSQSTDYTSIISKRHYERLVNFIGQSDVIHGGSFEPSKLFIEPTLIKADSWNVPVMQDEIFGPLLPMLEFNDFEKLLQSFKTKEKPLAAYLYSENSKEQNKFLSELSAGGVCINDCLTHVANHSLPFGGVGESGMGKYHGLASIDTFTNTKAVVNNPTFLDLPLRYSPMNSMKSALIRLVLNLRF